MHPLHKRKLNPKYCWNILRVGKYISGDISSNYLRIIHISKEYICLSNRIPNYKLISSTIIDFDVRYKPFNALEVGDFNMHYILYWYFAHKLEGEYLYHMLAHSCIKYFTTWFEVLNGHMVYMFLCSYKQ